MHATLTQMFAVRVPLRVISVLTPHYKNVFINSEYSPESTLNILCLFVFLFLRRTMCLAQWVLITVCLKTILFFFKCFRLSVKRCTALLSPIIRYSSQWRMQYYFADLQLKCRQYTIRKKKKTHKQNTCICIVAVKLYDAWIPSAVWEALVYLLLCDLSPSFHCFRVFFTLFASEISVPTLHCPYNLF